LGDFYFKGTDCLANKQYMSQTVLANQTGANISKILRGKLYVGCFSALRRGFRNIHQCSIVSVHLLWYVN